MYRLNYEKKDLGLSFSLAVGVMLVASLALGLIFGVEASGFRYWLMQALYTLLIGGTAFIYAVISKTNVVEATKINKTPHYSHFLWGCLAVVFLIFGMMPLNTLFTDAIKAIGLNAPEVTLEDDIVGLLVVACLLPCFTEEILFRGTIAQSIERNNKLASLAISGALFAIYHANPSQTLHQFVLGAFLTLLVFRSGSLWTSVIVHFFNNSLVVALSYTTLGSEEFWNWQSNLGVVLPLMIAGLVGFVLCVFGYLKTTKSVWQKDISDETVNAAPQRNVTSTVLLCVAVGVCVALWVSALFVV